MEHLTHQAMRSPSSPFQDENNLKPVPRMVLMPYSEEDSLESIFNEKASTGEEECLEEPSYVLFE